jgi:23S rRNA pseudouridine1911/1915/1917 synthase
MNATDHPTPLTFTTGEGDARERLDKVLAALVGQHMPEISRTRLQALVKEGHVRVDGEVATDTKARMRAGQEVSVTLPDAVDPVPRAETIALDVVYEDDDLIVIDKPFGLVVHPGAGNETGTLVNALIAHCGASLSGIGGVKRPGIVHRLDKDTTGLMVVAKNDRAHQHLAAQFADHGREGPLERSYRAIVWGDPTRTLTVVDAPLDRDPRNREKMAVVSPKRHAEGFGRHAITHIEKLKSYPPGSANPVASLMRCTLETGRTHQIRVHMAHVGHPLLGDVLYGAGFKTKISMLSEEAGAALLAIGRQALHAAVLGFEHPATGEHMSFESALPPDMVALDEALTRL